ncbi:MAG: Lrp/AsnC family transcriptional regulator [Proteobacteria bacterium]|nr:Lrp/AsnC family transcriptional regulator [Pseudomonadota bacterium]
MSSPYPLLDAFDRKILEIVQTDNMLPHREISETVCLSVPAVAKRLQRLRREGVIMGDASVIRPEFVGVPLTIIVTLGIENESLEELNATRNRFIDCPQVQQCYHVTGEIDFILILSVRDIQEYESLTHTLFSAEANVRAFRTFVVLQRPKVSLRVPIYPG